mgnify:CR=1 FL=1
MRKLKPTHFANLESGWRCVILLQEGRKWVRLRLPTKTRGLKLKREVWDKTPKHPIVRGKVIWD